MELSPKIEHEKHSAKIAAVVQVHASLRNKMLPKGPLHGKAELIYMTSIAPSNATVQHHHPQKEVDELIFLLPHSPEAIRFWIDERPFGHPDSSKEKIRKGRLDDGKNCSVIKVCINRDSDSLTSPDHTESLEECDIYLPPCPRTARVWIYLDPEKAQDEKRQIGKIGGEKETTVQPKQQTLPSQSMTKRRSSLKQKQKSPQRPLQKPQPESEETVSRRRLPAPTIPTIPFIPIPERRSSRKAIPRSPLSSCPPINGAASPPEEKRQSSSVAGFAASALAKRAAPVRRAPSVEPEPEGFKNDVVSDISRLMTNSDPFGRFHNTDFPDLTDSEEEKDTFPTSPLGGDFPALGQAQAGKFYKAGRRAQSSVFFEQEGMPGQKKIEILHDEKPDAKTDFIKPSRRRTLKIRLSEMLHRRKHH